MSALARRRGSIWRLTKGTSIISTTRPRTAEVDRVDLALDLRLHAAGGVTMTWAASWVTTIPGLSGVAVGSDQGPSGLI